MEKEADSCFRGYQRSDGADGEIRTVQAGSKTPSLKGVEAKFGDGGFLTPSEFMRKKYKKLVDLYAGKAFAEDFYYIIDKFNQFPYSHSVYRRSVRTKSYLPCLEHVFRLLYACRVMNFYECTLADYLLDRLPEEKLDYKRHPVYGFTMQYLDDLIAGGRLTGGDEAVTAAGEGYPAE